MSLRTAFDNALATLRNVAGESVSYNRGAGSVTLIAGLGKTDFEVVDPNGVQVSITSRDFIVDPEELVISSSQITPRAGDSISYDGKTFRVLDIPGSTPYTLDPSGVSLRIHTKQVG